jgi:hypothetical protein
VPVEGWPPVQVGPHDVYQAHLLNTLVCSSHVIPSMLLLPIYIAVFIVNNTVIIVIVIIILIVVITSTIVVFSTRRRSWRILPGEGGPSI